MITFWHLLLMLWLGGAIAVTYLLYSFARLQPEEFEDSGLDGGVAIIAVVFWPYAMFRAVQLIEHEVDWRKRHEPKPVIIPAPPEWCSECERGRMAAINEAMRIQYEIRCCDDCKQRQNEWAKKYCPDMLR